MCGGTLQSSVTRSSPWGLSPRVRGNLDKIAEFLYLVRSIPACAGEPLNDNIIAGAHKVYPRVCGGTPAPEDWPALARGLSPRVRGNQLCVLVRH